MLRLLFLAAIGMPLSLWLAGAIVRGYIVMVALPIKLEREHHKPVVYRRLTLISCSQLRRQRIADAG
jgi:hypothetical protein